MLKYQLFREVPQIKVLRKNYSENLLNSEFNVSKLGFGI